MKNSLIAMRVAVLNLVLNTMLAFAKLATGVVLRSAAMLSDGAHSVADALSGVAVVVGIHLSARRNDARHPYGYERMECVAAVILAILVGITGVGIGIAAVEALFAVNDSAAPSNSFAWITALAAILIKEGMFRYTRLAARKTASAALMADAWHQRTDALSSFGGLIGVVGANMGFPTLDPLAGVAIALLILKAAVGIFADAMRKMIDRSCDEALASQLIAHAQTVGGVCEVVELKTRLFGNRVLAEITVRVEAGLSAEEAYAIADAVKTTVESDFDEVKTCSVHIHPSEIALCDCKTTEDVI